eukprot:TRINITY_DN5927_c0_g1_i1.p1 TRINITY_DN5927_c0_g1~~TRINITY_DN5927_c0_g1_i1.p1  ORF type:complete len:1091 (+),score=324.76 TRINITY_DN5927_c0_g1_i1:53-3325(+)
MPRAVLAALLLLAAVRVTEGSSRWLVLYESRVPRSAHDWVLAAALQLDAQRELSQSANEDPSSSGGRAQSWQPCALRSADLPCACDRLAGLETVRSQAPGSRGPFHDRAVPLSAASPSDVMAVSPLPGSTCCQQRCSVAALRRHRLVRWVAADSQLRRPLQPPDADPLPVTGRKLLAGPLDVVRTLGVDDALWRRGARGQGVRVAIFDTGIARRHHHFRKSKIKLCINYTDQRTCEDGFGHGTFVSGLVVSQEDCLGMAPEAELYAFKVFTDKQVSYTSWFLDAFNHAIDQEIDVLNLSIGGPDYMDQPFVEKVWEASANGIMVVSAIGNDGPLFGTLNNPADQFDVLGVGGVTQSRRMAPFSSRGMSTWELPRGYGRIKPDVVTYGELVRSSDHRGGCKLLSGTSVASPVVTGAVSALMSLAKQRGKPHNPAAIKQVLVDTARPIAGASIYEQGSGVVNIKGAAELLANYVPRPSFLPRQLLLDDCPYMWPFCKKPLFHSSTPLVVNITVLNPTSRRATWVGDPVWYPSNPAHAQYIDVATEQASVVWPWSGWFAVSLQVPAAGRAFTGQIEGRLVAELDCEGQRHSLSLRIRAAVIPTPDRSKRVLWDMYHNLQYPPGYVPRDDLQVTSDILEWNGDHPHTNFKDAHDHLVKAGYYIDVLTSDYTTFDAELYSALLIIDTEEEFLEAEVAKLESDVREKGLAVLVFADWYNEEVMQHSHFKDDNTGEWWTPVTGGANVPALNDLLAPFGIAFSTSVLQGDMFLRRDRKPIRYASGTSLYKFPAGGVVYRAALPLVDQVERSVRQRTVHRKDVPVLGVVTVGRGRIAAFGDSNCLDSAHSTLNYCFDLLSGLLSWAAKRGLPQELQRAELQVSLNGPWQAHGPMPARGESAHRLRKVSHVLRDGGDHVRGAAHRPRRVAGGVGGKTPPVPMPVVPQSPTAAPVVPIVRTPPVPPFLLRAGQRPAAHPPVQPAPETSLPTQPAPGRFATAKAAHDAPPRNFSVIDHAVDLRHREHKQQAQEERHDPVITVAPTKPDMMLLRISLLVVLPAALAICGVWRGSSFRRRRRPAGEGAARYRRAPRAVPGRMDL